MRIFVAQLNPIVGDLAGNTKKIIQALERARAERADLFVSSELSLCGYPPEDLLLHHAFIDEQQKYLEQILPHTQGMMAFVGMVRRAKSKNREKPIFNSAAVLCNGMLLGYEDKRLLPTYDVFDERRYFEPGERQQIWEFKGKRIGVLICEDIWQHAGYVGFTKYAHDPVEDFTKEKPDLIINLSASPYQFNKLDIRKKVCAACATTLHCPVVYCCQVGANDQLIFDGYSLFVDSEGNVCQIAKGFAEDDMLIDLDATSCPIPVRNDPVGDLYQALVLGVRDYFHKLGFEKGVLGVSGGVDSALVACVAVEALGAENVLCVAMPSRYNSAESLEDARALTHRLGVKLCEIPIDTTFQCFLELLEPHFEGRKPDVTEENLQTRIRGTILMSLSNKLGYLLLNTGNKSEMGMGYCTLYGDMCGSLSVIADVTKHQVYMLCDFINRHEEIIPRSITTKAPSAELHPGQKDSDTLPPYEIIDKVLEGYVEEYLTAEEIASRYSIALETVEDLIHRIHLAEYKRRQAPPGIRVSKKAFRVGRRYPIVQGWA